MRAGREIVEKLKRTKAALEEFEVLHARQLKRNNIFLQTAAGCTVALVAIIGFWAADNLASPWAFALCAIVVVLGVAVGRIVDAGARHASKRIGEIEAYVGEQLTDGNLPLAERHPRRRAKLPD